MRFRPYSTYFFIVVFLLLLFTGIGAWIISLDYDTLLASILLNVHKEGLEQKIRDELFTRQRFLLLKNAAWLIFILAPLFAWLAYLFRVRITGYCNFFANAIAASVKAVVNSYRRYPPRQQAEIFILLLAVAGIYGYRMIQASLTYDEMWCYNYFTAQPFYYSFFTNSNYPLYEISTHFFKWLPLPMKVNLRLSPFISSIAACILLYACLRKYFNHHNIALAGVASFAFMPLGFYYAVNGKGVAHELFFCHCRPVQLAVLDAASIAKKIPGCIFCGRGIRFVFHDYACILSFLSVGACRGATV